MRERDIQERDTAGYMENIKKYSYNIEEIQMKSDLSGSEI